MSRQPPPAVPRAQLEAFRGRASCVAGTLATLQAKSQTAIEFLKNHLVKPLQASGKDVSGVIEAVVFRQFTDSGVFIPYLTLMWFFLTLGAKSREAGEARREREAVQIRLGHTSGVSVSSVD
jgi:hypothetical protein